MWLIVYVCCVEKGLKSCWIIVDVTSCLSGCELCNVMKMVISSLFVWACHLHYSEALVVTSVMYIEKEWVLKRMYHFEGRIARRDGYYISRDVLRAAMVTIIKGRVVRRDRCMDRYVPHGSRTERQRVCITRSDMHHYTWHCIPLHCTYLLLVNLISCFADLLIASCETCDCWILSLLLRIYNLLKSCCWGYVIFWSVVVEDM